jgi:microcystin-dependent protein
MAYTKTHSPWGVAHLLSGYAFNHLESQYAAAKADADLHSHDTRYYTKTSADLTFFTTSYYTGFDADTIDGSHFSDLVTTVMPLGAIMIWSGTDGTVPAGWHICDGGTYGGKASPDLRDRFVIGAGDTYDPGDTGGPASWNGTFTPTGTVTIGDHVLTESEIPVHTHPLTDYYSYSADVIWAGSLFMSSSTSKTTTVDDQASGDGSHGHPGSTASFTAVDPRPTFYSLYYIMKYE